MRKMSAFGKKSLAWVYKEDKENNHSCKSEQQSGSFQNIHSLTAQQSLSSVWCIKALKPFSPSETADKGHA